MQSKHLSLTEQFLKVRVDRHESRVGLMAVSIAVFWKPVVLPSVLLSLCPWNSWKSAMCHCMQVTPYCVIVMSLSMGDWIISKVKEGRTDNQLCHRNLVTTAWPHTTISLNWPLGNVSLLSPYCVFVIYVTLNSQGPYSKGLRVMIRVRAPTRAMVMFESPMFHLFITPTIASRVTLTHILCSFELSPRPVLISLCTDFMLS